MRDIAVIICAHNPRKHYLRRVLDGLQNQTLSKQHWELLLIDNASSSSLASEWNLSWHPNARHVLEPELGLSAARLRGMRESGSDVLVFVDDDNVLEPGYLSTALRIGLEWPRLGTWGSGSTLPEYEQPPPGDLKELLPFLALRDVKLPCWGNVAVTDTTPWGAGLCVRREVAEAYLTHNERSPIHITDRKGSALLGGGDVEISYVARDIGFGTGVFPELRLIHLIPKQRVTKEYLLKIYQAGWVAHMLLTYKWEGNDLKAPRGVRAFASMAKNMILRRGLDRERYLAYNRAIKDMKGIIREIETKTISTSAR
jgi:glycosyltransferase involved in cell wall biosynthesis